MGESSISFQQALLEQFKIKAIFLLAGGPESNIGKKRLFYHVSWTLSVGGLTDLMYTLKSGTSATKNERTD